MNVKRCDQCGKVEPGYKWCRVTSPIRFEPQKDAPGYGVVHGSKDYDFCSALCVLHFFEEAA